MAQVLVRKEGVSKLMSDPLSSTQLGWCCQMLPLYPSCPLYPTYSSFILGWRDPTCSIIAHRNCAHSVILGALLWSFSISAASLFFEMQGSERHPLFKVWVNMDFEWYNDFLILCSFPNSPEHMICLFWLFSSTELVYFYGPVYHRHWRTDFGVVIVSFVRPWLHVWSWDGFFSYVCHFSLCNRWSFSLWWKRVLIL